MPEDDGADQMAAMLAKHFEQFLLDSLNHEPAWSDMILHGSVDEEGSHIPGIARWRLPTGWQPVELEAGVPYAPFESNVFEFYMRKWRRDPTAFNNGDSLRVAVPAGDKFRLRVVFFSVGGRSDQYAIEVRRVERQPRDLEKIDTIPQVWKESILKANRGLYLLVGPTCSGKTSTAYSVLEKFNQTRAWHIITIEDPIENTLVSNKSVITQTEVGQNSRSYADAMNGSLVKAPNVIFIGEIKDPGTAVTAIQAANTGHLVLATMHVDCCETAVERLLELAGDTPAARKSLAATLRAVLGQTLVPTKDGRERILVCDTLMVDGTTPTDGDNLRKAILDGNIDQLRGEITRPNSKSRQMNSTLIDLVKRDRITVDDAIEASTRSLDLRARLR